MDEIDLGEIRVFDSGAIRDTDEGKLQFIRAMSPFAIEAYLDYLHRHNNSAHRREENWKKGMPLDSFMDSLGRHFLHQWKCHEEGLLNIPESRDALCAIIFNAFGYLHELVKPRPRTMLDEFRCKGEKDGE